MLRSFLSVGQGAFYCECFGKKGDVDTINIVYDCGSLTNVKIVEREIKNNFRQGEIIEALFISHLDEDHINGVPFLLKYCNVKRIYFPLITSQNRKLMEIYYHVNNVDGFIFEFFTDPYETVRNLSPDAPAEVIGIGEASGENEENEGLDIQRERTGYQRSGEDVFGSIYGKKTIGNTIYDKWLYIPFNFRQQTRVGILLDNLRNQFGSDITEDDLVQIWKNNAPGDRDKIKQAYRNIPGNFNTNSMVLFSGETDYGLRQYTYGHCMRCCPWCDIAKRSGCLYTGDYDASGAIKWKELKKAYKEYWKHIGCVQIPHHGSYHNFNEDFLQMDAYFVISAGYANRYHHPHSSVVKALLLKGIMPHIVTEQVGSAAYFLIDGQVKHTSNNYLKKWFEEWLESI